MKTKNTYEPLRSLEEFNSMVPRFLTEIQHSKRKEFDLKRRTISRSDSIANINHTSTFLFTPYKWLREMFLPVGYPYSVHRCYWDVHFYQFIETYAAQLVTVITAQALLTAVGASQSSVNEGAAVAIQWTLTNGFGEVGKLIIIQQYSYLFDSYPKASKLLGEICCITGNFLHIATLFFPNFYIVLASVGYCLYGIYLSIWAATHTTFNTHLALKDNIMGDLNAKDDSQVSLAHILGLLSGVTLLSYSNDRLFLLGVYMFFSLVQIVMTILLVRAADYEVLNFSRMRLVADALVHYSRTLSCRNLKGRENWTGEIITLTDLTKIRIGTNIPDMMSDEWIAERLFILRVKMNSFQNENYLLVIDSSKSIPEFKILLREKGTGLDVFKAVIHATKWASLNANDGNQAGQYIEEFHEAYLWTDQIFTPFFEELKEMDWKVDILVFTDNGVRIHWPRDNE